MDACTPINHFVHVLPRIQEHKQCSRTLLDANVYQRLRENLSGFRAAKLTQLDLPSTMNSAIAFPVAGAFKIPQQLWPATPSTKVVARCHPQRNQQHMLKNQPMPSCIEHACLLNEHGDIFIAIASGSLLASGY